VEQRVFKDLAHLPVDLCTGGMVLAIQRHTEVNLVLRRARVQALVRATEIAEEWR
jgi:hypothetical protein